MLHISLSDHTIKSVVFIEEWKMSIIQIISFSEALLIVTCLVMSSV